MSIDDGLFFSSITGKISSSAGIKRAVRRRVEKSFHGCPVANINFGLEDLNHSDDCINVQMERRKAIFVVRFLG
jgi:hypothetical protein